MSRTTTPEERRTESVTIRPERTLGSLGLSELWRFRHLLYWLAWRDIRVRYAEMHAGLLWALVQPAALVLVLSVALGYLARVPSDGARYSAFVIVGIAAWTTFSTMASSVASGLAHAGARDAAAQSDAPIVMHVRIESRAVAKESRVLTVSEGGQVEIHWTTDERVELHLHGYDIAFTVDPDQEAVLRFEAFATGRFPVTAHGFRSGHHGDDDHAAPEAETTLLHIEVYPR